MKKKLIKKHQQGDPIEYSRNTNNIFINQRQAIHDAAEKYYTEHPEERDKTRFGEFAFRPVRYAEGMDPYIDTFTGKPILNGQNILTRNGKVVTTKSQDWLDWLAETGQTLPELNLPELHVEYNKDTKSTRRYTGQSWDEMNAAAENAPIATTQEWEQQAQNNFDANSIILQNLKKREADRRAHELTPGVGSLALLGTIGTLAAWNPLAFITSLGAAKIGEETLDFPFQQQGYQSFGDWWLGPDASDTAKKTVNLGTWLGGGAGYSTAKMYQAAVENLAKRFGTEWTTKSLSAMYPTYNPYPQLALEVPATEISSTPLRSSKLPGVFFVKAGEANKGSVSGASGNWQIKALMPGNALERKLSPDGTISWKDFEWYLKQKPVEPYDRIHLQKAAESFSKDKPIPYEELKKVSSDMIPKFDRSTSDNLKGYGLDALNLGSKTGKYEHYGMAEIINPDEGVNPESIVFRNSIGGYDGRYTDGRVHFPDAIQHMRGFTIDTEPGVYYYLEGQSDWAQQGLAHGDFIPGSMEEHMAETAQLRGIQEALFRASEQGNSVMRIPTPETLVKSQYYRTKVTQEGQNLIYQNQADASSKFQQLIDSKYPEYNSLRQAAIGAEHSFNTASHLKSQYLKWIQSKYQLPRQLIKSPEFLQDPEKFLQSSDGIIEAQKIRELAQNEAEALSNYSKASQAASSVLKKAQSDPVAVQLREQVAQFDKETRSKFYELLDDYPKPIVAKYKAFPKHFRRLFGDKPEIRNITDSKGNTWFEVDVPKDIATKDLVFSKAGEFNEGSASGLLHKIKTFVSRTVNPISEKNLANVSLEEIESAIQTSLENRNFTAAYRLNKLYQRKKFQQDHQSSFEPKIENTQSNVTPVANVTRENIGTLSPEQINTTYSYYAANKDYTSAEKFRNLYRKKFGEGEPITMDNKESIPDVIWDIQYFKALKKNNLQEAARLRDLHFLAKSKNNILYTKQDLGPIRYYHSTDGDNTFNVFDFSKVGTNYSQSLRFNRPAFFFTPNQPDKYWGDKTRAFFLNAERPATNVDPLDGIPIEETRDIISKADSEVRRARPVEGVPKENNPRILTTPHRPYWEMVMFDPKKIKLTDPITEDGENIIPLSWRDNFNQNNVLFSTFGDFNEGSAAGASKRPILSQRFNFGRNDKRYSWLLPLVPFLLPNKKDQAD